MGNPYFKFKQFTIHHDRCAMKVGMDGSLLGAWTAEGKSPQRVLDIGTGTGLIALMCAQRFPEADIFGIDVEETCLGQARENIDASPWKDRVHVHLSKLQEFKSDDKFDLIVCNPPFFKNSSKSGQSARDTARHDDGLPFEELVFHASQLLSVNGTFALIIPEERASEIMTLAEKNKLHLQRSIKVKGTTMGPVKRRLLEFSPTLPLEVPELGELTVEIGIKEWSDEYKSLLREFYVVL